jgi:hypothetical protein
LRSPYGFIILTFGKNGTLVSLSATGKAQKGRKFSVVLLMIYEVIVESERRHGQVQWRPRARRSSSSVWWMPGLTPLLFLHRLPIHGRLLPVLEIGRLYFHLSNTRSTSSRYFASLSEAQVVMMATPVSPDTWTRCDTVAEVKRDLKLL